MYCCSSDLPPKCVAGRWDRTTLEVSSSSSGNTPAEAATTGRFLREVERLWSSAPSLLERPRVERVDARVAMPVEKTKHRIERVADCCTDPCRGGFLDAKNGPPRLVTQNPPHFRRSYQMLAAYTQSRCEYTPDATARMPIIRVPRHHPEPLLTTMLSIHFETRSKS